MATTTINTTGAHDARLVVSFGRKLRLGRNATAAEIKADLIEYMRQIVQSDERVQNTATFIPDPLDPT